MGAGAGVDCEPGWWIRSSAPSVRPMAPTAKNTGRNSRNAAKLAAFGRSDGGGKSVMTVDLCGPGGPDLGLSWPPLRTFCPQRRGRYILMPERAFGHNNTIGLTRFFSALAGRQTFAILPFDTLGGHPYKRGSHGERGVPKTSRVLVTKGFATQMVPLATVGLGHLDLGPCRALYASFDWKGIRRRRRSPVPYLRIRGIDDFVVASSKSGASRTLNLVTGSKVLLREG